MRLTHRSPGRYLHNPPSPPPIRISLLLPAFRRRQRRLTPYVRSPPMDDVQARFERAVAEQFLNWYNAQHKSCFQIITKGESPDFVISDSNTQIGLEITAAYYDSDHAKFLWQSPRKFENALTNWSGVNFDDRLVENIFGCIESKAKKPYGKDCILLIYVRPGITSFNELIEIIQAHQQPNQISFSSVYVVGSFPHTASSKGGDHVFCVSSQSS